MDALQGTPDYKCMILCNTVLDQVYRKGQDTPATQNPIVVVPRRIRMKMNKINRIGFITYDALYKVSITIIRGGGGIILLSLLGQDHGSLNFAQTWSRTCLSEQRSTGNKMNVFMKYLKTKLD